MAQIEQDNKAGATAKDALVKCTRCRNTHLESARIESAPNKTGMTTMICPRCGGHSFYRLPTDGTPA